MTKKLLFLVPGAIALMFAGAPMLTAQAQTPTQPTQRSQPQAQPQTITLTEAQRAEITKIREAAMTQIQAILTKEQKAQLATAQQPGAQNRQVSLNLTPDQRTKINGIVEKSRNQIIQNVLTQQQRDQLLRSTPQSTPQR